MVTMDGSVMELTPTIPVTPTAYSQGVRLADLLEMICQSDPTHWNSIDPPYAKHLTHLEVAYENVQPETFGYYAKWVYVDEIQISIALSEELDRHGAEYQADWNKWPNRRINEHFLDIMYHGQIVYRELVLGVDGGRVFLPSPKLETVDTGQMWHEPFTNTVTERQFELASFFAGVQGNREFDGYFKQAGFVVLPEI